MNSIQFDAYIKGEHYRRYIQTIPDEVMTNFILSWDALTRHNGGYKQPPVNWDRVMALGLALAASKKEAYKLQKEWKQTNKSWEEIVKRYLETKTNICVIDCPELLEELRNYEPPGYITPYLTKEQIEAEGWLSVPHPSAEGPSFRKDKYALQLLMKGNVNSLNAGVNPNNNITIWTVDTGNVLFLGECKSINDLRTVFKLLNI